MRFSGAASGRGGAISKFRGQRATICSSSPVGVSVHRGSKPQMHAKQQLCRKGRCFSRKLERMERSRQGRGTTSGMLGEKVNRPAGSSNLETSPRNGGSRGTQRLFLEAGEEQRVVLVVGKTFSPASFAVRREWQVPVPQRAHAGRGAGGKTGGRETLGG